MPGKIWNVSVLQIEVVEAVGQHHAEKQQNQNASNIDQDLRGGEEVCAQQDIDDRDSEERETAAQKLNRSSSGTAPRLQLNPPSSKQQLRKEYPESH